MRKTVRLLAGAILVACAAGTAASELPRIDRSLVREPKYLDKPRYFLLVFGPEARTRVWCVLDDSTLYVDRNGDGDLTDPGERFTFGSSRPVEVGDVSMIEVGDITETDRKTVHRHLRISRYTLADGDSLGITVEVKGEYAMVTHLRTVEATDRPQDAPFCHFNGPLRILCKMDQLVRGENAADLCVAIGTYYRTDEAARQGSLSGLGVMWAEIDHGKGMPPDIHPVAEVTFPPRRSNDKPIVVKVPLTKRC